MSGSNGRTSSVEVAIIGGGIMGCSLAYDLTNRGVKVMLLDRHQVAREASWASAGIISPPSASYGAKADMAVRSFRRYRGLVEEVEALSGVATGWVQRGIVHVAAGEEVNALRDRITWQREQGFQAEWLDPTTLGKREPALRQTDDGVAFAAGLYNAEASSLLLGEFSRGLARAAAAKGAVIREHTVATHIETNGSRAVGLKTLAGDISADQVVIAAGAWSRLFGEDVGVPIPTRPVRGQMIAIADVPIPITGVIQGEGGYLVPRADGTVAVGATEEHEAGFVADVTPAGIDWLAALIDRLAPSLNQGRLVSLWAGLRPASEDGELIVGRIPSLDNVWVSTGHFRAGALLAPGSSELLAESIVAGKVVPGLAAFDPGRFA
ncbi:MAG: FAD-dependent oxidoreductase [Nitrolancea sp.]